MAPKKNNNKGKSKVTASRGSTTRRAAGSTTGRMRTTSPPRTPSPVPSPPSTPESPRRPNRHKMTRAEERAWMGRKPRTESMGKFGQKKPEKPERVDIHGGRIYDDKAKKTLLAIIRTFWPIGSYTYTDISAKHPGWMDEVLEEFKCFYKNLRGQSRFEATWSIKEHVKRTCKRMMNEEKDRLTKKMKETGMSAKDLRPSYFHPSLWDGLLKYWDSEEHKHRASVGASNRKKVVTLHSAGAKAFDAIEMEMTREKGKKPRRLELWDRTHTTAASRRVNQGKEGGPLVYTTPEAMAIAARYSAILEREGVDLTPGTELSEPIQWWLQATTNGANKPKKNRLVGFPTVPASSLLPDLAHRYREGSRGGAGSSSSAPNRSSAIPDRLFVQVVRHAVTSAQTDPAHFQRQLNDSELEGLARNVLEVSDPASRGNFNSLFFREVVNVVTNIMNDICNKYEEGTRAAIEQANQDLTEGESSDVSSGDDDGDSDDGDSDDGEGDDHLDGYDDAHISS